MSKHNYIYYGTKSTATDVEAFIRHMISVNEKAESQNHKRIPLCIWGRHGIGKTELVEAYAKKNGYDLAYIAPAQFEEMGDLIGMPNVIKGKTVFVAPEWVPRQKGPGILLIDDVNRADDRILRGIMQLLQNYELVSWKLPPGWHIILSANPDGGDYSVTPMDDAMITRMMHISMEFNVKAWAKWAAEAGVDSRGISFVLMYPEMVHGDRTTPRTLVQFFESISGIEDLSRELPLVQVLADSCLDSNTAATFISFVRNDLSQLIGPQEIVKASDFGEVLKRIKSLVIGHTIRVDILSLLCTRLANLILLPKVNLGQKEIKNIQSFILMDFLPNDLRLGLLQDIVSSKKPELQAVLADPEIGKLLLGRM